MDIFLTLVVVLAGLVTVCGGLPMALGRLRPNRWYGYRTPASLADTRVWDRTNRVAGRWFVGVGVLVIAATLTMYTLRLEPATNALSATGLLMVGALAAGGRAYLEERRLTAKRETAPHG